MNLTINKNSPTPVFYQIQHKIREEIENGSLVPGTQLPTERELSKKLEISRDTVRRAIRGLVTEGYCTKKVGKGIFVSGNKIPNVVQYLMSTTDFLNEMGFENKISVVLKKVINPDKKLRKKLELDDNDKVLYVKRIRTIKNKPVMLENLYLSLRELPDLEKEDFNQSFYKILQDKYNFKPHHAEGKFNVMLVKKEEAELLNLQYDSATLVKEAIAYNKNNIPLEYGKIIYRSDKFEFVYNSKQS